MQTWDPFVCLQVMDDWNAPFWIDIKQPAADNICIIQRPAAHQVYIVNNYATRSLKLGLNVNQARTTWACC